MAGLTARQRARKCAYTTLSTREVWSTRPMEMRDIVVEVAKAKRRSRRQVEPIVREVFRQMVRGIERDGEVAIYAFGRIALKKMGARQAQDFSTGERISLPRSEALRFTPGRAMKRAAGRRR